MELFLPITMLQPIAPITKAPAVLNASIWMLNKRKIMSPTKYEIKRVAPDTPAVCIATTRRCLVVRPEVRARKTGREVMGLTIAKSATRVVTSLLILMVEIIPRQGSYPRKDWRVPLPTPNLSLSNILGAGATYDDVQLVPGGVAS